MNSREIGGAGFAAMLRGGLAFLKSQADRINELNVFPIPDGDTGDNMVSTLSGGVRLAADCTGGIGEQWHRQLYRRCRQDGTGGQAVIDEAMPLVVN